MKVKSYNDMKLTLLWATPNPDELVAYACQTTMKNRPQRTAGTPYKLVEFLMTAKHTSVFEHCVMSFMIENVSRSFLAQITRHRVGSFTSASQHYQDYTDMPMVVHPVEMLTESYIDSLEQSLQRYEALLHMGMSKEEARQVLPNACAVNIMWTVNLRSLINFFELRLCMRNVAEMQWFSVALYREVKNYWPEFAQYVGPTCRHGKCNQGPMSCGNPWSEGRKV